MARMKRAPILMLSSVLALGASTCSTEPGEKEPDNPCAGAPAADGLTVAQASRFPTGSAEGHKDPTGAKAAGQARAGRVNDQAQIRQPDNARSRVRMGDYLLINDKIAVYIEGARTSDGYSSLGGEILAIERVGDDGRPRGESQYNETLLTLSRQAVAPERVTVLNDGADGKPAVVRVSGVLKNIPFLDSFADFLPGEYGFPAALDYVLEPGSERLRIRLSLLNVSGEEINFDFKRGVGFFQSSRSRVFTAERGYEEPQGYTSWVGFDSGDAGFIFRVPGSQMRYLIGVSGFLYFQPKGFVAPACQKTTVDYAEIIPGGPGLDGLLATLRRVDGEAAWREISGQVSESGGAKAAGAVVHVLAEDGRYLTRAVADGEGRFTVRAPRQGVKLRATLAGYDATAPLAVTADATSASLQLSRPGVIQVKARDAATNEGLPVRVQVIPKTAPTDLPAAMGVVKEANGRLWQHFSMDGQASLSVPPGEHRVLVSRGFEWEILDKTVTVEAGKTVTVDAPLQHSVDSRGVMCADFHIHTYYSADSADVVERKVRGAVADGLEIPVSSEHEWIIDFQPVIQALGVSKHAFGFPSEEFTTFTWGHFGIIPLNPRPQQLNNGAISWVGRTPGEVFAEIRGLPEKPVLIVNHPSGAAAFGGAYFTAAGYKKATGTGDAPLWSDDFDAVEVFNDSGLDENREKSVADWFGLLNAGKIKWAVGSSDSHDIRTSPVGYPRTCLRFGHDDPTKLSAEAVRDVLRRGEATIAGGLYMTVQGPGGVGPGGMLPPGAGAREFEVVVQAPSWLEATTLEVIVDGETASTQMLRQSVGGPGRRYEARVSVTPKKMQAQHYVVFHASAPGKDLSPLAPGRKPFAVSNPIFF
jgi:hypothetical protein